MQLKVVWSLSLQTGSEGPALISNAASRFPMFRVPRSWHTIIRVPHDDHVAFGFPPSPPVGPEIKDVVQIHVGEQW
jgi:hypothetical protein